MSTISLKDLVSHGYNVVSIDGKNVNVVSSKLDTTTYIDDDFEKKISCLPNINGLLPKYSRFSEYFEVLRSLNVSVGDVEPAHIKSLRPFLLSTEVATVSGSNKGKQGKVKKGAKKGLGRTSNKDIALSWSLLGKIPSPNRYVPSNIPYVITQETSATGVLATSATLQTFFSRNFHLSLLDQASSLETVFDQYRLSCVEWYLVPRNTPTTASATTNQSLCCSVVDYDDANNLTSFASAQDYTNALTTPGGQGHYHKFTPHVAVASYSGAFTSFTNVTAPWIDCASDAVQHFGIKVAHYLTDVIYTYDEITRLTFEFRNIR